MLGEESKVITCEISKVTAENTIVVHNCSIPILNGVYVHSCYYHELKTKFEKAIKFIEKVSLTALVFSELDVEADEILEELTVTTI